MYDTRMYISPPTFLQLHVESAPIALLVGAVGRVGADPALQVGGGGRRGPGHQVVGQGGVVPTGLRRAPRDGRVASAEPRGDVFICIYLRTRKKTQPKKRNFRWPAVLRYGIITFSQINTQWKTTCRQLFDKIK